MKLLIITAAALACAAAAPVAAQGMGGADRGAGIPSSHVPSGAQPERNRAEHSDDRSGHAGMSDPNNHGQKMSDHREMRGDDRRHASSRHVRACQQRYRSYNPRTDRYVVRHGMTRRCTL